MTLVFELDALKRVMEPQAVVVDARRWAQHVCLATTDPESAQTFSTVNLLRWECQVEPAVSTFQQLSQRFQTDRYVLVGVSSGRPDYLPADQWDYRNLTVAAEAANWEIETQKTPLQQRCADRLAALRRLRE
ncbi:DUF7124 domain-containing protein [Haloarcula laminariae]|uniref:DUF7124 domain-containing protein n=1 Tax=Haloarcula laminariae TaxID=2961577 RepID=UPI0024053335|nr:hypothetical protein [Halomicroarcula sp. FL173]